MKFSVITPVYNVAPYLRECLDSVLVASRTLNEKYDVKSEKCEKVEIICVDDGSTDGSGEILDEYGALTDRALPAGTQIRVMHQTNAGVSAARNKALKIATGEWVLFVDADDVIAPRAFTDIVHAIRLNPVADVIAFRTMRFTDPEQPQFGNPAEIVETGRSIDSRMRLDTDNASVNIWEKSYRHDIIKRLTFRPYVVGEDQLFLLEAMLASSCTQEIGSILYGYRQRLTSVMHTAINPRKIVDMINYNADELALIKKSQKIVAHSFIRIVSNWLTERVACHYFQMPDSHEKREIWEYWRRMLIDIAGLTKIGHFQRFRLQVFANFPFRFIAYWLFYFPGILKEKGLHR